jgi:signal peptidase I
MLEPAVAEPVPPPVLRTIRLSTHSHVGLADVDPWPHVPIDQPPARRMLFGLNATAEVLEVVALALVMFLAVRFVAQNFVVDGSSMSPTFATGDLLIVNKLAYSSFDISWLPWSENEAWQPFGDPSAGDVVVFHFPGSDDRDFIKRVIATPGQTVQVERGQVFVDGVLLDEPFIADAPRYDYGPEVVPNGMLFVLGDNRNNSYDSHSWGMLDRAELIGRAEFRYWPPGDIGNIGHGEGTEVVPSQPPGVYASP